MREVTRRIAYKSMPDLVFGLPGCGWSVIILYDDETLEDVCSPEEAKWIKEHVILDCSCNEEAVETAQRY